MAKERIENNYMEALLRAALVIGGKHPERPVREVTVAGYKMDGEKRVLYPRCKTIIHDEAAASSGEDHLILYRM